MGYLQQIEGETAGFGIVRGDGINGFEINRGHRLYGSRDRIDRKLQDNETDNSRIVYM